MYKHSGITVELTDRPDEERNECENCNSYSNIKIKINGYADPEYSYLCTECAPDLANGLLEILANKELIKSKNDIYRGLP